MDTSYKGKVKNSILDHVYCDNKPVDYGIIDLNVGDHFGVYVHVENSVHKRKPKQHKAYKRDWSKYTREKFANELQARSWAKYDHLSSQQIADNLDNDLLTTLQKIAPEIQIKSDEKHTGWSIPLIRQRRKKN